MKKTMIRAASKNLPLACLTLLLILSSALFGQTTEPTTQPVLTLEQQISALDSLLNSRVNPPTPDDRVKLSMQRLQLRQQLSQEEAIKNAPRLAAEKAARDVRAAADKAKTDKAKTTADTTAPEFTIKRLNAMGADFLGQTVTTPVILFKCTFDADPDYPNDVKFGVRDTEENGGIASTGMLASKKDFAELLLGLKRDQAIRINGVVVRVNTVSLGLRCKTIEILKNPPVSGPDEQQVVR